MNKIITFSIALFTSYNIIAQETKTVEGVYEDYINAIGGKEKIKGIANIMVYTKSFGTSYSKNYNEFLNKETEMDVEVNMEMIYFDDISLNQRVVISKYGDYITKLISFDGKTYIEDAKGKRTEAANPVEQQSTIFLGSKINPGSEVSLDTYNSEEVYVIKSKGQKNMTNIKSVDVYEYFSTKTGLLLATKSITAMEENIQSIMIIEFSDYREVQGILVSHTQNSVFTTKTDKGGSETKSKATNNIQLNIDVKDFQDNCFKKPEKCFKKYN